MIRHRDRSYTIEEASALAIKELTRGNARAAADIYNLILVEFPDHAEAYNHRGIALQEMKRYNDALADYERAITVRPSYADAHLNRGNVLLALRRFDEALASYNSLIDFEPDCAAAYNSRGITLQEMKRHEDALTSYDKAIALKPDYLEALNNRGLVLRQMTRFADALASYDKAIAVKPGNAVAHNNRGLTLQELKQYDLALASFDRALALKPDYAVAHNNRGVALREMNQFADALASFDRAIALKPDYAMAYNNRGLILREMRRYTDALASFDKAITIRPDNAMIHNNRGLALQEMKLYDDSLASCDKAIALKPDCAEAHSTRGATLSQLKLYDDALASCDKAIWLKPDYAEAYQNRGVILVSKGDMQEAERMFLKALALKPDLPMPLFSLAKIRKYQDADHADVKAIQILLNKPGVSLSDKEHLYFALGKIYDDCGLYDDAFESYRQANQICNAAASYDPERVTGITNRVIDVFTEHFLAQTFSFASDNESPLFVVGMPRSGTTLMASILSNHRSIGTAGELPTIAEFSHCLGKLVERDIPYPQAVAHITPAVAFRLINDYVKRLRRDIGSGVPLVIDKNPLNFRHLGFISMLFPKARIIHCMRHPIDTCLSNYYQHFSLNYDYSFDLRNIGHFYGEYVRTMEHWRTALPGKMIEVSYEDMIMNTEKMARATLDSLGLEWDERCLAPHTNPAPVETASNWQVRQPIYKESLDRWRNYEKHLAPLKEMLNLT
jgi:tetratricopeptide (TPR) repeat protein